MVWQNRTKVVATVGPASSSPQRLGELIRAGVDVVRLNCAHASRQRLISTIRDVRRVARERGTAVGILADLQGPKIRVGKLKNAEPIYLKRGLYGNYRRYPWRHRRRQQCGREDRHRLRGTGR